MDARTVTLPSGERIELNWPRALTPDSPVRLLIRPEWAEIGGSGSNTVSARVANVTFLGDHSEVRLELGGGVVIDTGDRIRVTLPPDAFLESQ